MEVLPVRLPPETVERIERVARAEHIDRSAALRKIVAHGLEKYVAERYGRGELTLREAADWLCVPLREALERLARAGAGGNVTWEQARQALLDLDRIDGRS